MVLSFVWIVNNMESAFWIPGPWCETRSVEYVSEENQSNRNHTKTENLSDANPLDRRGEFVQRLSIIYFTSFL